MVSSPFAFYPRTPELDLKTSHYLSLIDNPMESDFLEFQFDLDFSSTRLIKVFEMLFKECEKGLTITDKGNFSRKFLRSAADEFLKQFNADWHLPGFKVNYNYDFSELMELQNLCDGLRLARRFKGKYVFSKKAHLQLKNQGINSFYKSLFEHAVLNHDWRAWEHELDSINLFREAAVANLLIIKNIGHKLRPPTDYSQVILDSFPAILEEFGDPTFCPQEEYELKFESRFLKGFCNLFGFIQTQQVTLDDGTKADWYRSSELLDKFLHLKMD